MSPLFYFPSTVTSTTFTLARINSSRTLYHSSCSIQYTLFPFHALGTKIFALFPQGVAIAVSRLISRDIPHSRDKHQYVIIIVQLRHDIRIERVHDLCFSICKMVMLNANEGGLGTSAGYLHVYPSARGTLVSIL